VSSDWFALRRSISESPVFEQLPYSAKLIYVHFACMFNKRGEFYASDTQTAVYLQLSVPGVRKARRLLRLGAWIYYRPGHVCGGFRSATRVCRVAGTTVDCVADSGDWFALHQ